MEKATPKEIVTLVCDLFCCLKFKNVGGKTYCTTKTTLTNQGENFFSSLLSDRIPSLKDKDNNYFIDRNGTLFEFVLDFLRTGDLDLPEHISKHALLKEARFYLIDPLIKLLEHLCEESGDKKKLIHSVRTGSFWLNCFFMLYRWSVSTWKRLGVCISRRRCSGCH